MRIYLAGPIDYEQDHGKNWRQEFRCLMHGDKIQRNFVAFDPVAPYYFTRVNEVMAEYIHNINMVALNEADVIVARLLEGQQSIGTPIELYEAKERNLWIILITDMQDSVYMSYIGTRAIKANDIADAYQKLVELSGRITKAPDTRPYCDMAEDEEEHPMPEDEELMRNDDGNLVPASLRKLKFVGDKKDEE